MDIEKEARKFASELGRTLNTTIADNVRLSAVPAGDKVFIGHGIKPRDTARRDPFQLLPIEGRPRLRMLLSYSLSADPEKDYLMVESSVVALSTTLRGSDGEADREMLLLHVDYEREKEDGYPEAHLQVIATSDGWRAISPGRDLGRLHLPVGPRRFRPSLEDVIELVAREGLAGSRDGWREVVEAGRQGFQRKQLRAAIRRNPVIARDILAEIDAQER